jgi:CheY-like chemotaxis protein
MVTDSTVQGCLVLVEDDAAVRGILRLLFESAGWDVLVAPDGAHGLAEAERVVPDVVVTDLRMPHMSGIDLARELAAAGDAAAAIPVIAITSDTSGLREAAIRSGLFVEVLSKPLSPGALLQTVRQASLANGESRGDR